MGADPSRNPDLLRGTVELLILKALTRGRHHGFGIARWLEDVTDDVLRLEEGSLYPALHRLVKRGWLKAEWGISEANQRARYYQLTATGKAQLAREQDRWSQLVDAIGRVMNPSPIKE